MPPFPSEHLYIFCPRAMGADTIFALPAYQDYTIRAKVVEMMNMAGTCKTSVAEYYQSRSALPATTADAGCLGSDTLNAKAPAVTNGLIEIKAAGGLGTQLTGAGSGDILVFTPMCVTPATPACVGTSISAWDCKLNSTIAPRYLPVECR